MAPKVQADDIDIQIAIYDALGFTPDEVAAKLSLSLEAVQERRSGAKASRIETIKGWAKDALALRLDVEIASVDVKRRINAKAYEVIEKALDSALDKMDIACEACGRKPLLNATQLAAAREAVDRSEGKALDRKSILSSHTEKHEHTYTVDGQDLSDILTELARLNARRASFTTPSPKRESSPEPEETLN